MPKKKLSKIQIKPNIRGKFILCILEVVRTRKLNLAGIVVAVTLEHPYMNPDTAVQLLEELVKAKMIMNKDGILSIS